jgi:isopropylmalate/homocitrate/citramalate synthase
MRDTADVIDELIMEGSKTRLLAIVANTRGALEACKYEAITYIGFPLSLSDTFQKRNTNKSIGEALNALEEIKSECVNFNKQLVTYISMGFGQSGCKRFDGALRGFGGCPMATDDLVGNLSTENILGYLQNQGVKTDINPTEFAKALALADEIFPKH